MLAAKGPSVVTSNRLTDPSLILEHKYDSCASLTRLMMMLQASSWTGSQALQPVSPVLNSTQLSMIVW